jgi:hypothetical protein
VGSSAREHKRRYAEKQRYAESQLRANRATPGQPATQVGTTRAEHAAEHKDRAVPRGDTVTNPEPNREGAP